MIRLERAKWYYFLHDEISGKNVIIDTDYDYPGLASNFGWTPCPFCRETDGTVDCKHRTAGAMMQSAQSFLDKHIGETAEDPGYFS
jgi:hypothetical protein